MDSEWGNKLCSAPQFKSMVSNLYLCPWDGAVRKAGGHDDARQIADVSCGVCCWSLWGAGLPALIGWSRSHTWTESQHGGLWIQGSGDRQALSVSGWCPFFPAMLKYSGTQSRLFRLVTLFSLISFHLVPLLLLTSAHSRARCLASDIRQPPLDSRYAEVGSASQLIPPQEWITKWKWPQGSQVQPDQLTAAFLSPSLSSCLSPLSFWRCWTLT